jgi:hypothetical protein
MNHQRREHVVRVLVIFRVSSGMTKPIAFAAPVECGIVLSAAERAARKLPPLTGPSKQHLCGSVGMDRCHCTNFDPKFIHLRSMP